jgi:polyisoprenoid-binding protein YceI
MKKKYLILSLISIALLSFRTIAPEVWKLDTTHSNLGFSVSHLGVSYIKGTVKLKSATVTTSSEDFSDGIIILEADMASIDTDNDGRDEHLRTADFFDSGKFPTINFQSTSFKKEGESFVLLGNLTLHGITKPVKLNAVIKTGISPVNNKPITGIKVTGTIKRTDFDIAVSTPESILADEVAIEANLEFAKD